MTYMSGLKGALPHPIVKIFVFLFGIRYSITSLTSEKENSQSYGESVRGKG